MKFTYVCNAGIIYNFLWLLEFTFGLFTLACKIFVPAVMTA